MGKKSDLKNRFLHIVKESHSRSILSEKLRLLLLREANDFLHMYEGFY